MIGDTPSETDQHKNSDQVDSGKTFFGGKASDERDNDYILRVGEQTSFFGNDKSDFSMVEAIHEANNHLDSSRGGGTHRESESSATNNRNKDWILNSELLDSNSGI